MSPPSPSRKPDPRCSGMKNKESSPDLNSLRVVAKSHRTPPPRESLASLLLQLDPTVTRGVLSTRSAPPWMREGGTEAGPRNHLATMVCGPLATGHAAPAAEAPVPTVGARGASRLGARARCWSLAVERWGEREVPRRGGGAPLSCNSVVRKIAGLREGSEGVRVSYLFCLYIGAGNGLCGLVGWA